MKINNINSYMGYNGAKKPAKPAEEAVKSKNYDMVQINKNDKSSGNNIEKLKKDVAADINKEISTSKIESIRESIKNKTYEIDVEEIVKKLLNS